MAHSGKHGYPITKQIRAFKRTNAEARQKEYDKLSTQQKLDKLPASPHCEKQRTKLLAKLEAEKKPVKVKQQEDQVK